MTTVLTAWKDANDACFGYLSKELKFTEGRSAWMGDELPDNKVDIFAFLVSGGREQTQNYQAPAPAHHFIADAALLGQFKTMEKGFQFAGKLQNVMPANQNNGGRGIAPNVQAFEVTGHPEMFSRVVEKQKAGKKAGVTFWMVRFNFRVVYNGQTN